jgi:hypothetical protein
MITSIANLIARFRESVSKDPGRFAVGSAVNDPLGLLFAEEALLAARVPSATDTASDTDQGVRNDGSPDTAAERLD